MIALPVYFCFVFVFISLSANKKLGHILNQKAKN